MSQISLESNPILVVSNASYDFFGNLDDHGVATMEKSAAQIGEQFDKVVIITPTDSRTVQGAHVMGDILNAQVVETPELNEASDDVSIIGEDLAEFLGNILDKAGVKVSESAGIVYAGHAISAAAAKGVPRVETIHPGVVKPGEIVPFSKSKWGQVAAKLALAKAQSTNWDFLSIA